MILQIRVLIFFLIILGFCMPECLRAQFRITLYEDIGENNVVASPFFKTATIVSYQYDNYMLSMGNRWDFNKQTNAFIPDIYINYTQKIPFMKQAFDWQAFFLYVPFSKFIYEIDGGLLASYSLQRLRLKLGTHFRMFGLTRAIVKDNAFTDKRNIFEHFNVIYLISYYVNRPVKRWNIGFTITNIDYFTINQETNPIFNVQISCDVNPTFSLFCEGWYKSAGAFNLSVNPFGFFIRSGCLCKIQ